MTNPALTNRPQPLEIALILLLACLILGIGNDSYTLFRPDGILPFSDLGDTPIAKVMQASIFLYALGKQALFALLIYKVWTGRTWARTVILILWMLTALFILSSGWIHLNLQLALTVQVYLNWFTVGLKGVAICLLFNKQSKAWLCRVNVRDGVSNEPVSYETQ